MCCRHVVQTLREGKEGPRELALDLGTASIVGTGMSYTFFAGLLECVRELELCIDRGSLATYVPTCLLPT